MKHLLGGLAVGAVVVVAVVIGRSDRGAYAATGDTVADFVYGQFGSFTTGNQNCYINTSINAGSLCSPNGVTIDSAGRLWIADTYNHRVLEYDTPLTSSTATRVFGQGGSFTTGIANKGGLSANSLNSPTGVAVDSAGRLYIADDGNHRVLEYDTPLTSATANRVFGQFNSFTTNTSNNGGTSASSLWNPYDVAVDSQGNLYVSDRYNRRVLEYDAPVANDTIADTVFGQLGSMTAGVWNNGGLSADSLSSLVGIGVDPQDNLYVADDGNNRVLVYYTPLSSNTTADFVFGQGGSFTSGVSNNGGLSASSIDAPRDVTADAAGNVYIAETGNERTLEYNNPFNTDDIADVVFGQGGSFTTGTNNSIGLNASSQADPWSVTIDADCHLWVADLGNNRVLEYDSPPPGCAVQPTFTPTSTVCPVSVCTATPTHTATHTPTITNTPTATPTCIISPTDMCTATPTATPTCDPITPCVDTPTPTPTCISGTPGCDDTPTATATCDLPGCGTPTPTATDTATSTATHTPTATATATPIVSTATVIATTGGTVSLPGTGTSVTFVSGSLVTDVLITLEMFAPASQPPPPAGQHVLSVIVLDSGELGFGAPATIAMGYTDGELGGASPSTLGIWRYDGGSWHLLGGATDTVAKTTSVHAQIVHRSPYALMLPSTAVAVGGIAEAPRAEMLPMEARGGGHATAAWVIAAVAVGALAAATYRFTLRRRLSR